SLQDLSRRTGVSYVDLVTILQTEFINPGAVLLPQLQSLCTPLESVRKDVLTIKVLHDNLGTAKTIAPQFIAALPAGLDATQYGGISPTDYQAVVNWVTSETTYTAFESLITIINPTGAPDDGSGAVLQLRYALSDNANNNMLNATDFLKLIRFIRL